MKLDDKGIIAMFHKRNEEAIRETEKKYKAFIFSICDGILHQKQDSEECVNTVYKKLWDTIPPECPDDLKAYIARLSRTTATDVLRTNGRYKRGAGMVDPLDDYADFLVSDHSVIDEVCANELAKLLNGFLKDLPDKERVCFVKRYYFGCPVEEIVKQTRIPRSTVYMMLEKVKNELKTKLSEEGYL